MNIYRLKDVNLKEHINEIIGVECVITEVECRATKKNDPYLFIHTMDMDKKLKVTLFDNVTYETAANFKRSSVMLLFVQVSTYEKGEDGISCVLKSYENSQTPLAQFIKWEDGFERARDTILEYCDKVKHTCIGKLTVCVLQRFWKQFYNIPAAKSFHHVYLGGLMVHTCCVVELSKRFAEFYNEWYKDDVVNVNLVLCGALLHDIGKLNEFDFSDGISVEYSNDSLLMNHITSGIMLITEEATRMGIADRQEVKELIHLIASHHGRLEWGSPVEPHCIEADILSFADQTDASVNRRVYLNKDVVPGTGSSKKIGAASIANYKVVREAKNIEL